METNPSHPSSPKGMISFFLPAILLCGLVPVGIICISKVQSSHVESAFFILVTYLVSCIAIVSVIRIASLQKTLREMRKMQAQANKLNRLGAITGKVAHNLNNVLSGIATYPEVILLENKLESSTRQGLNLIRDSGQHASGIVRDLLTISQDSEADKERLNINTVCETYVGSNDFKKLKNLYTDTHIDLKLHAGLPDIHANYLQIEKMFEKLTAFALNEVSALETGVIRIETFLVQISRTEAELYQMASGRCAALRVSYRGPFTALEDQRQVFEPFFLSKHLGKPDSGLGLTLALFVVEEHGGSIEFQSEDEETSFEIYFPALPEQSQGN